MRHEHAIERRGRSRAAVPVSRDPERDLIQIPYDEPHDGVIVTRQVWTALRRHWPTAVCLFSVVVIAVIVGSLLRPDVYRASGLIEIRSEEAGAMPVGALFGPQELAGESLATAWGILESRAVAERVVRAGHLEPEPPSGLATLPPFAWLSDGEDSEAKQIEEFREHLVVSPQEGSRLARVSYEAGSPERAAAIVNATLDGYLALRADAAGTSVDWLARQRDEARGKLEASQRKLQDYVRQHGLQVLETGQGETENLVNDRLKQLHGELTRAQAERYARQAEYELVRRQASAGVGNVDSPVIESLSVRLADLQRDAAGLAATFHEEYPRLIELRRQARAVEEAIGQEGQAVVSRAERSYRSALRNETLIEEALDGQQGLAEELESSSAGYASMRREVATDQELYEALDQELKELNISAALMATNGGVVDYASPPLEPYQSPLALNLAVGLLLGAVAGIGGALLRGYTDDRLRRVEDIDGYMGVPTVGVIPMVSTAPPKDRRWLPARSGDDIVWSGPVTAGRRSWYQLDRANRHRPVLADAFAALRAALLLSEEAPTPRRLLVTSPGAGEGKTTISVNLALALARQDQRVLIVDADLRRPSVHEALGIEAKRGLAHYLETGGIWQDVVQQNVSPGLSVMPAGAATQASSDLVASSRMRQFLVEASAAYDFVIIDSPPLLAQLPDARILSSLSDGVLLTVRGGSTTRDAALRAVSQIRSVVGVFVNAFDPRESPAYYGSAYYGEA
jgi:capsular exopolysaccharide synthesis family protein